MMGMYLAYPNFFNLEILLAFSYKYLFISNIFPGGSVRGGQILGEYPEDITDDGPLALSRGKVYSSQIFGCSMRFHTF